jgi:Na+/phosphate symporter
MPHPYGHDEFIIPPPAPPLVTTPPPLDMRPISQVVDAMTKEDKTREAVRLDEERRQKLEQERVDTANVLAAAHNRAMTQVFLLVEKMLQKANECFEQEEIVAWNEYVDDAQKILNLFEQGENP